MNDILYHNISLSLLHANSSLHLFLSLSKYNETDYVPNIQLQNEDYGKFDLNSESHI